MIQMIKTYISLLLLIISIGCSQQNKDKATPTAEEILGNSNYLAMSDGGYRYKTRDSVPSIKQLKDDLKILAALNIKLLRTYNTQHYTQTTNLLKAIRQLKEEDPSFEMYLMLGAWIQCENSWTAAPNHNAGDIKNNTAEIDAAVALANEYPKIIKMIAVGNEAMAKWAAGYYVYPKTILKWVNHLQELKKKDGLTKDIWITSSDNYAAWGGGPKVYHTEGLTALIEAVDFISLHTYPFHDSYHNPNFWAIPENEEKFSDIEKINAAMQRAINYAKSQYQSTADYIASLNIKKSIHIGETGWASLDGSLYGKNGSHATDEYKEKLFHDYMRTWTNTENISCFYFKLFDESWKNPKDINGSENNFGMIDMKGQAKYPLWEMVDKGIFKGLTRDGIAITKTYNGDKNLLMKDVLLPPTLKELGVLETTTVNKTHTIGTPITEKTYVLVNKSLIPDGKNGMTYPSESLKINAIDGSCKMRLSEDGLLEIQTGTGKWWACTLQLKGSKGEDLSKFKTGHLNFEIKGNTTSSFQIGFQTGFYSDKTQITNAVVFGPNNNYALTEHWVKHSISIADLNKGANLKNVTDVFFLRGNQNFDGKQISIKNIYYTH